MGSIHIRTWNVVNVRKFSYCGRTCICTCTCTCSIRYVIKTKESYVRIQLLWIQWRTVDSHHTPLHQHFRSSDTQDHKLQKGKIRSYWWAKMTDVLLSWFAALLQLDAPVEQSTSESETFPDLISIKNQTDRYSFDLSYERRDRLDSGKFHLGNPCTHRP